MFGYQEGKKGKSSSQTPKAVPVATPTAVPAATPTAVPVSAAKWYASTIGSNCDTTCTAAGTAAGQTLTCDQPKLVSINDAVSIKAVAQELGFTCAKEVDAGPMNDVVPFIDDGAMPATKFSCSYGSSPDCTKSDPTSIRFCYCK